MQIIFNTTYVRFFLSGLLTGLYILLSSSKPVQASAEIQYPYEIAVIEKTQADYLTPENTFAAKISALLQRDLDWYYETLSPETVLQVKKLFREAEIDPERKFGLVDSKNQYYITEKKPYKHGILLVGESKNPDGRIIRGPVTLIQVNGLWKITSEFAFDEELQKYSDTINAQE